MESRRIVVTGGNGFLGRVLVESLRTAGYEVQVVCRSQGVDVSDGWRLGQFLRASRPDWVIHLAGHTGGPRYLRRHALEIYHDNLQVALGLADGLQAARVPRLITVLPAAAYPAGSIGAVESHWWEGEPAFDGQAEALPARTLAGLCRSLSESTGLSSTHLILPEVYGPQAEFDPARAGAMAFIIAHVSKAAENHEPACELAWPAGYQGEWLYVEDAAAAVLRYLRHADQDRDSLAPSQVFNVAGHCATIESVAGLVQAACNWEGTFQFSTNGVLSAVTLDGTAFTRACGWAPATPLESGVPRTVAAYQVSAEPALAP